MKLEKYIKQNGAKRTAYYREVGKDSIRISKGTKTNNVDEIYVTLELESGETHTFQGGEQSQDRLTRRLVLLQAGYEFETEWKTIDNKFTEVTVNDIIEILTDAARQQDLLWKDD